MYDGITGKTIDIIEDRHLDSLIKCFFFYYDYKTRSRGRFIIIDKFHLTQLISRLLNKTLNKQNNNISSYMKAFIKTLLKSKK